MFRLSRIVISGCLIALVSLAGCQQGSEQAEQAQQETAATPTVKIMSELSSPASEEIEQPKAEDPVIATVNGDEIHRSDLIMQMQAAAQQQRQLSPQDAIEQAISERLLLQAAEKAEIVVDASEVAETYNSVVRRAGGEENFQRQIAAADISVEKVKDDIRRGLILQKVLDSRTAGQINVTDATVESYYRENPETFESVHARHILIKSPPGATQEEKAEAIEKIEAIEKRIEEGEDFAELAKEESEGPSAERGGDLGEFGRGRMVPSFEEAVFSLEPGEISGVVETQYGYHIIEVLDREKISLEEVRDRLKEQLEKQQRNQLIGDWLDELSKEADIEIKGAPGTAPPPQPGVGMPGQ